MTRPRHPQPAVLATQLRQLAALLDGHGTRVLVFAGILAARGYPTGGNAPGRTSDTTSSTERAALNPHPWAGIDDRYAHQLQLLWEAGTAIQATITLVLAHAPDNDPVPAGTGSCRRCERFCRPDGEHPDNRIRSGYCPACYRQWLRLGKPDRSNYERTQDDAA